MEPDLVMVDALMVRDFNGTQLAVE